MFDWFVMWLGAGTALLLVASYMLAYRIGRERGRDDVWRQLDQEQRERDP